MKTDRRQFIATTLLTAGVLVQPVCAQGISNLLNEGKTISLRGRVVCLTEELQRSFQLTPDCAARGHVYSLRTDDGQFHPFLPTELAAAIWLDARVRERELQVTARPFPPTDFIEVIKLQSWRFGKLCDLDYYCDVCSVATHKPGPCVCCQEPVQFRETPVEEAR
jgi:hypothetical protein